MKQQFNKKKFWTIVALLALVETLVLFCVFQWRYIFPSHEVSEIYTRYENTDGIDASFIKDFRVNDSVFIDVTLLEAKDSAGWALLCKDFDVPTPSSLFQQLISEGKDIIYSGSINKTNTESISEGYTYNLLAISYQSHTLSIFHLHNEEESLSVLNYNLDSSIQQ